MLSSLSLLRYVSLISRVYSERKERNKITSVLDRPITVASDHGVCRWQAAKMWQILAKLLKLNLICIISCTTSKKRTKIWTRPTDFYKKKIKPYKRV